MFLDFYKMNEQPFGVTPDPRFLYLGRSHREALASLSYGIESDRGFVALIAQPGLGKTTLTFQLLEKLKQSARTVFIFETPRNSKELFQYTLNALGIDATGMEFVSMHNKINEILYGEMVAGRRFVLAMDEAQNLDPEVLESIRMLSNFETSQAKLLQILLIGQPQLAQKLASPSLEQLQQRISVFARLDPFDSEDTAHYVAHRLQVAGYQGNSLFSSEALQLITEQSQGIPRKINRLCFSALSLGFAMGRKQVDVGMMDEVIADLNVESLHRSEVTPSVDPSPVTTRSALFSYPGEPKRNFGRWWALGAASGAASVVIGVGILSFSPGRPGAWPSIRNASASVQSPVAAKSDFEPVSSAPNVRTSGFRNAGPGRSSPVSGRGKTSTIIVQTGDTFREIVLRTMGDYSGNTIEQIRKLNPSITNLDHVEAGQAIRLPRASAPINSASAGEQASAAGKN